MQNARIFVNQLQFPFENSGARMPASLGFATHVFTIAENFNLPQITMSTETGYIAGIVVNPHCSNSYWKISAATHNNAVTWTNSSLACVATLSSNFLAIRCVGVGVRCVISGQSDTRGAIMAAMCFPSDAVFTTSPVTDLWTDMDDNEGTVFFDSASLGENGFSTHWWPMTDASILTGAPGTAISTGLSMKGPGTTNVQDNSIALMWYSPGEATPGDQIWISVKYHFEAIPFYVNKYLWDERICPGGPDDIATAVTENRLFDTPTQEKANKLRDLNRGVESTTFIGGVAKGVAKVGHWLWDHRKYAFDAGKAIMKLMNKDQLTFHDSNNTKLLKPKAVQKNIMYVAKFMEDDPVTVTTLLSDDEFLKLPIEKIKQYMLGYLNANENKRIDELIHESKSNCSDEDRRGYVKIDTLRVVR